ARRRAHGAQLPRPPVGDRDPHGPLRQRGRGDGRAHPRHPQDDARFADGGEGGGLVRRRHEPPHRAVRRDPHQGEPRGGRRRGGGGGPQSARRAARAAVGGRGADAGGAGGGARRRRPAHPARQHGPRDDAGGGGAHRRPRLAGGERRRDARAAPGDRGNGDRLHLDRGVDALGPGTGPISHIGAPLMSLPLVQTPSANDAPLMLENIPALQAEVRELAAERGAVILAHNYQLPEIQDVADYVGDSLGLSQQAARADQDLIVFCGVHFMAETASVLCPEKRVLIPDLDAGCSLADSITAEQLRGWKARHPGALVVMYVNTTADVKAETDYCVTSSNAVAVVEHILREHGEDVEILFGPDMFLGAYVEKRTGRKMHVWDGECHVHAGIRPADIEATRASHPDAELLVHPECGCSTSVMEYVAAGDIREEGVHILSTGGMLAHAQAAAREGEGEGVGERREAVVATEVGMLYPLQMAAPQVQFIPANPEASCRY